MDDPAWYETTTFDNTALSAGDILHIQVPDRLTLPEGEFEAIKEEWEEIVPKGVKIIVTLPQTVQVIKAQ